MMTAEFSSIAGFHNFFSAVTKVQIFRLVINQHLKINLFVLFETVKVIVPKIINRIQHVRNGWFPNKRVSNKRLIFLLDKGIDFSESIVKLILVNS